jgi:hypothetical protein
MEAMQESHMQLVALDRTRVNAILANENSKYENYDLLIVGW